jgi:uncharacterized membrane protein YgcG
MNSWKMPVLVLCCAALVCGCASRQSGKRGGMPSPDEVTAPDPIQGNTGQYMCPYDASGKLNEWMQAVMDSDAVGPGELPVYAPKGGPDHTAKDRLARDAKRQQAAAARAGGFDAIRAHSDLSFSSADDLCLYLYVKHSRDAGYGEVFESLASLYPDMGRRCREAIRRASAGKDEDRGGPGGSGGPGGGGSGGGPGGGGGRGGGGMGGGGWGGGFLN